MEQKVIIKEKYASCSASLVKHGGECFAQIYVGQPVSIDYVEPEFAREMCVFMPGRKGLGV